MNRKKLIASLLIGASLVLTGCQQKQDTQPNMSEEQTSDWIRGKFGEAVGVEAYKKDIPKDAELENIMDYIDKTLIKEQKGFKLENNKHLVILDANGNSRVERVSTLDFSDDKNEKDKKEPLIEGMDFIDGKLYKTFPKRNVRALDVEYGTKNPVTSPDVGTMQITESLKELKNTKRYYGKGMIIKESTHFSSTEDPENPPKGVFLTNRETKLEKLESHLIGAKEQKIWVDAFFYFDKIKNKYILRLSSIEAVPKGTAVTSLDLVQEWKFSKTEEQLQLYQKEIDKETYNKLAEKHRISKEPLPEDIVN